MNSFPLSYLSGTSVNFCFPNDTVLLSFVVEFDVITFGVVLESDPVCSLS